MKTRIALLAALSCAACATEKLPASEALGPELTVHTLPKGAEVYRDGKKLGTGPVDLPVRRADKEYDLEARKDGFLGAKVIIEAADLQKSGGGETWIALKPESMGTDTPDLDAMKASDLVKGGLALAKKKQCALADEYYVRALQVDPGYARTHRERARCLQQLKNYDLAATELENYMNIASDLSPEEREKLAGQVAKLRGKRDIELTDSSGH